MSLARPATKIWAELVVDVNTAMAQSGDPSEPVVTVEWVSGLEFRVRFPSATARELEMDEPAPSGKGLGPNASLVLASSVGNCLSASLAYCLARAKVGLTGLTTTARATVTRNAEGLRRVSRLHVRIVPTFAPGTDRAAVERCAGVFEKYCVVTEAVRAGIPVEVSLALDPT